MKAKDRLIVALDVPNRAEAIGIVDELRDVVGAFKIGLQLFTAEGPGLVHEFIGSGAKLFLDLKFHDIPNTVARASIEAARMGVWMFNIHASGGSEMMRRTFGDVSELCVRESLERPLIIGVTVLTSSGADTLRETGVNREVSSQVASLAQLTSECGLDGVVASPLEVDLIRKTVGSGFLIVTPGIRPFSGTPADSFETSDDQQRVMTPASAVAAGSDYIVVGRPILMAPDRRAAAKRVVAEIENN